MNITFNCDENYSPYLSVLIKNILDKRSSLYSINFYVLDLGISEESKNYISELVNKNNSKIKFISVDQSDFDVFPQTIEYISKSSYARLKIADYLQDVDKTIYLDIDIIVNDDLRSLWNTGLKNQSIAACVHPFIEIYNNNYKKLIGLSNSNLYFNAGIIIFDLDKCRKENMFQLCLKWINQHKNFTYQDQDILNGVFEGKVMYLNSRFNFTVNHRSRIKEAQKSKITLKDYELCEFPICIYHHTGPIKAWHSESQNNKSEHFYKTWNSLEHKPKHWHVERITFFKILKRKFKETKDKIVYKIY